jgi:NitT/TauT family transport system ATP-binding protein
MTEVLATERSAVSRATGLSIEIDGVEKVFGFGTNREFRALESVSLSVKAGEFVSVVGPSGCGKSTLMLMTAGLLQPSYGTIAIDGVPLVGPLTDVGIVFQDHLLLEFRTAEENVLLQGEIRKRDMGPIKRRGCSRASVSRGPRGNIPINCRGACSSAFPWRVLSSTTRRF